VHPDIEILLRFADGDLTGTESRSFERHLEKCEQCLQEVRRLQESTLPGPSTTLPAADVLAEIREWAAQHPPAKDAGIKHRMATEIGPYLGEAGSAAVLGRATGDGQNLLPAVEDVLADFLGRRAVGQLVNRIVEHAIVRT
jgi:anti-sigma factor RsiW